MPPSPRSCRISYRRPSTVPGCNRVGLFESEGRLVPALGGEVPSASVGASEGSKRVGDDPEEKVSGGGVEPKSEGDFTAAVPSAWFAGWSSGRRTSRPSMSLSPQKKNEGDVDRKRASLAAPDQVRLAEPAARLTKYTIMASSSVSRFWFPHWSDKAVLAAEKSLAPFGKRMAFQHTSNLQKALSAAPRYRAWKLEPSSARIATTFTTSSPWPIVAIPAPQTRSAS